MNNLSRDAERQGNNNNTTERQSNTTQLARNSHFSKKNWLPRVGLEPTTISSPGDALTNWATEAAQLAGPNPAYKWRSISTWWTGELKHWYMLLLLYAFIPCFAAYILSFGLRISLLLHALNPCVAAYIIIRLLFLYFLALSSLHPSTF